MISCTVPDNQSIYQALLDKAASYPADKTYQVNAYKKAAESVLIHTWNIYDVIRNNTWYQGYVPNVGCGIKNFIQDFIKANPEPTQPVEPNQFLIGAEKAMADATRIAAASAPKDVTTWSNDDAERAAFQKKLAASKFVEAPKAAAQNAPKVTTIVTSSVLDLPGVRDAVNALTITLTSRTTLKPKDEVKCSCHGCTKRAADTAIGLNTKPTTAAAKKPTQPNWSIIYTPENPRRSKRVAAKPKV